jgi:DNA polymerase-3 subunit chi
MVEVWFYHLERESAAGLLPSLLRRGLERRLRLSVETSQKELVQVWSDRLWSAEREGFLAHGYAGEPFAEAQPIWITFEPENANNSSYRFFVDGALPLLTSTYERASLLFDGRHDGEVSAARDLWRKANQLSLPTRYLRQDEQGQWRDVSAA